jgi:hypothetical protein
MGELFHIAAETLPIWRDSAIVVLALIVIGLIMVATEVYGGR